MKMHLARLALVAILLSPAAAGAQQLSAEDQADIRRVEEYLAGITTMQARFTQFAENAGVTQGDFYLSRPGRMRIEYDPPVPYLYVADGFWLTYWDAELEQRSDVLLGSSLADFITRPDVRLSGDVTVTDVRHADGLIQIELVQTSDPGAGLLTLMFSEEPLTLQRWTVVDAQGLTTEVWLDEPSFGMRLASDLFVAPRPRLRGGRD